MSPPAGRIPNFHDPPNLDAFVALTIALCVAFGTLAVVLRMYTKVFILRALAWEDCKSCSFIFRDCCLLLILVRCHCPSMGKVGSRKPSDLVLTLAAAPDRADDTIWNRDSVWRRNSYVERPAPNVLRYALCEIVQMGSQDLLTAALVGQHRSCCLRHHGLLHQTLYLASISSHICTHEKGQHVHLLRGPPVHLEQLDILSYRDCV